MTTRGAKRAATSDPAAPDLPSKRVMDGPSFDVHRAESSHQHMMAGPATLDPGRAEAASKHVRALNTQFASWVQLQLQNHPLEIWEDGLKDYISHASEIMDKFKDVVNWLKQNKADTTAVSSPGPLKDEKTTLPAADASKFVVQSSSDSGQKVPVVASTSSVSPSSSSPNIFSFSSQQTPPAFSGTFGDKKNTSGDSSKSLFQFGGNNSIFGGKSSSSESSKPAFQFGANNGIFGDKNSPGGNNSIFGGKSSSSDSSKSPFQFGANNGFSSPMLLVIPIVRAEHKSLVVALSGNQNTAEASADADEDAEPEKPSSPSVKKAEEKGIVVVHEAKCKVYVKHDDATKGWKDIGVGQLSIRSKEGAEKASKESTPTIVIRNDVGKILLNALIYKGIKMNVQKNTVASIFHTSDAQSSESDSGTVVARTYLFRLKNEEAATKLSTTIKEYAPTD
ncbi:hypothetical protein EJB05_39631 [Eragrostis curvula]|uniref:RanBD1 domain-containing protein n=1 Tax=Eragrostis curvula TaxID=38414 RepID=A0A5J9TXI0_9POAL|nr:hypothetical protein EJB05_39631 [Eragrostis curvula]